MVVNTRSTVTGVVVYVIATTSSSANADLQHPPSRQGAATRRLATASWRRIPRILTYGFETDVNLGSLHAIGAGGMTRRVAQMPPIPWSSLKQRALGRAPRAHFVLVDTLSGKLDL
jgi:hypothetical protein